MPMQYSIHGSKNTLSKTVSQWVSLPRVRTTLLKLCWDHLDIEGSRHLMKPGDYLKNVQAVLKNKCCHTKNGLTTLIQSVFLPYMLSFHVCLPTYLLLFPIFLAKYKEMKRIWQSILNVYKKVVIHSPIGLFIV